MPLIVPVYKSHFSSSYLLNIPTQFLILPLKEKNVSVGVGNLSLQVISRRESTVVRMPKCSWHGDLFWGARSIQLLKWPHFYELCKSLEKLVQTVYNIQITVVQGLIMLRPKLFVLCWHYIYFGIMLNIILLKDIPAGLFHLHMWLTIPTFCPLFELEKVGTLIKWT